MPIALIVLAVFVGALAYALVFHSLAAARQPERRAHLLLAVICVLALAFTGTKLVLFAPASSLAEQIQANRLGLALLLPVFPAVLWYAGRWLPAGGRRWLALGWLPLPVFWLVNLFSAHGLQHGAAPRIELRQLPWGETYVHLAGETSALFLPAVAWALLALLASVGLMLFRWRQTRDGIDGVLAAALALYVLTTLQGALSRFGLIELPQLGILGLSLVVLSASAHHLQQDRRERVRAMNRLSAVFNGAPDGVMVTDAGGRIMLGNPAAARMFGMTPGSLERRRVEDFVPAELRGEHQAHRAAFQAAPRVRSMAGQRALSGVREDGSRVWIDVSLAPIEWSEAPATVAFLRDASERIEHLSRLEWLANHDPLTGLCNRRQLESHLAVLLAEGPCAVAIFGVDNLGRINDSFGRDAGDTVLKTIAARLVGEAREAEVGRLEGDRFAVLLPCAGDGLRARVDRLLRALAGPVELLPGLGGEVSLTAGFAMGPAHGAKEPELLQAAELALVHGKRHHRRGVVQFDPAWHVDNDRWIRIAARMPGALARGEFRMVYQPRIHLADGSVAGFEALMRWGSGEAGVGPGEFIPVAEESGFIVEIGQWALRESIRQARRWMSEGLPVGRLAINISARQLADPGLVELVSSALAEEGLPASAIELEITETTAMERIDQTLPRLQALHAIGVKLALDDFGTGYSSLAVLQSLPFDVIKIDIAFVRRLGTPEGDQLVSMLMGLIGSFGLNSVAEGVETQIQLDWLAAAGCHEGQGWLFSRPLEADQVAGWLAGRAG